MNDANDLLSLCKRRGFIWPSFEMYGGVAGMFGMSLLWLTFLNIAVGIFVAFVLLGGRTRHMGHRLDAHTFVTRAAAKASIFTGFAATALWLCFVQDKEARSLGICWALFKKHSLLITPQGPIGSWYAVDSILVALPLSALVLVVVSAFTRRPDARHLDRCFSAGGVEATNQPVKEGV